MVRQSLECITDSYCTIIVAFIIEVVVDFLPRGYSFTEGVDGNVSLNLSVISGRIGREVVVSLHTCEEDSAASM